MLFLSKKLFLKPFSYFFCFSILIAGCKSNTSSDQTSEAAAPKLVASPAFSADSAYAFVQKQVDFGARVPNSKPHQQCGDYLVATLKKYGLQVTEQPFTATTFDGTKLNARNIIGSFNPTASKRILLTSHWDSRPFSDQDSLVKNKPVLAANDGASGVGVLLEIARLLAAQPSKPDIGVDIIFFDAEDWGSTETQTDMEYSGFCLGSKHWATNKHVPNYTAYFGILLDMVGAKGATFSKEGYSLQFAEDVVRQVWTTASRLGYNNYFIDERGSTVTDDHVPVNNIARIPMIDIIHTNRNSTLLTFFPDWHTAHDDMENIDPKTLKAVGQTLVQVLYQEAAGEAL
ncbi:M28 family peptidase [Dyadobacter sp. Leaf189]|uniref:M28 family peptidase n=1 Tax=Dyadobacter sp. Leaf189 TaxID=1736295 RepID=UPI0006F5C0D6|nr:M28 family peptidase [Dyadobacter sp. Leaf189]KQS32632.1 peptidase [Dyadobacter sp. Leaf189]